MLLNTENVLKAVENNDDIKKLWKVYQTRFEYAGKYTWEEITRSVRELSLCANLDVAKPSTEK